MYSKNKKYDTASMTIFSQIKDISQFVLLIGFFFITLYYSYPRVYVGFQSNPHYGFHLFDESLRIPLLYT